jgi:hypothetical protein
VSLLCCPTCLSIYWRGSHYKRMHARLGAWQAAMSATEPFPATNQKNYRFPLLTQGYYLSNILNILLISLLSLLSRISDAASET